MTNYTWVTPESLYLIIQNPDVSENIYLYARERNDLETILDNLELAGVEETRDFRDLAIEEDWLTDIVDSHGNQLPYFLELSKGDFSLYLEFEVHNFLGVVAE